MISRYAASAVPGIAVTLALFWTMQSLLDSGSPVTGGDRFRLPAVFTVDPPPPPPPATRQPPPKRIPSPPHVPTTRTGVPVDDPVERPLIVDRGPGLPASPGSGFDVGNGFPGNGDGPLVAVVRIEPQYPIAAASRGLEGFVTVVFDVTAEGTVDRVRVLESSHALFEPAAVRAAYRFRFKPRVVDGNPVASRDVANRFRFTLEER